MNEAFEVVRNFLETWVGKEHLDSVLRIVALLVIGFPVLWVVSRLVGKVSKSRFGDHLGLFFQRCVYYVGFVGIIISILGELGFNPAALLGAAGIVSVAIGFASQTSLSNIISGIFPLLGATVYRGRHCQGGGYQRHRTEY